MTHSTKSFTTKEAAVISESVEQSKLIIGSELTKLEKNSQQLAWIMGAVVVVMFIAVVTMLAMVAGLLLDAFHFNSASYKDYSSKVDIQNTLIDNNKFILEQTRQNQKSIDALQVQIETMLKSKK